MDEDDIPEFNLFAHRADDIIKSKLEAYEKLNSQVIEEETSKNEENEYNDLMCKIKEKLKRKPANRKRKKGKLDTEDVEEEEEEPAPRTTRRSTRKTKQSEEVVIEDKKKVTCSPLKLPVPAKRRLNELKLRTDREAAQIEEEIRRTLSSCDNDFLEFSETIPELEMTTTTLKINYLGEVSKVQVKENEKFATIFSTVAELFKLKASEILLCLDDRNIQIDDTPQSLNLKFFDVIDCIPYKESEAVAKDKDPNNLLIKVQSNDSRKKIIMHIHKLEKFQDFMEKYSKLRDIPLKDLKFEFDGETIQGTETPEDLEMESESCIDVQVKLPDSEKNVYDSKPQQIIPPIPQSEMLDICVLD